MELQVWPPALVQISQPCDLGKRADFLIRALRFINDSDSACCLQSLQLELFAGEQKVQQLHYAGPALERLSKSLWANRAGVKGFNGQMLLGRENFWDTAQLSPTLELQPGQETGVLLLPLQCIYPKALDRIQLRLEYEQKLKGIAVVYAAEIEIPLLLPTLQHTYRFPLRGAWMVVNSPLTLNPHRLGYSQEFALDMIRVNEQQRFVRGKNQKNSDYPGYGAEVLAAASGEVVRVVDGIPENPGPLGQVLEEHQQKELLKSYAPDALAGGNTVIVRHAEREYGYYAHLIPGSLEVKVGQKVKAGTVLGKLGNSGNSDAPHLHFHLMDGPELLSSRGLPCVFDNVVDIMGQKLETLPENHQVIHTIEHRAN